METTPSQEEEKSEPAPTLEAELAMVEKTRAQLHQIVDRSMNELIARITLGDIGEAGPLCLPLTADPSIFKGEKPIAVVLPNGREVITPTWRKVAVAILQDCNADAQRHQRLLYLCGRVNGNFRPILSRRPEQMDVPLKIDEGIYLEGKFDTGALLRILTDKILDAVGYDCQGTTIKYRDPHQQMTGPAAPGSAEKGPAVGMELRL